MLVTRGLKRHASHGILAKFARVFVPDEDHKVRLALNFSGTDAFHHVPSSANLAQVWDPFHIAVCFLLFVDVPLLHRFPVSACLDFVTKNTADSLWVAPPHAGGISDGDQPCPPHCHPAAQ